MTQTDILADRAPPDMTLHRLIDSHGAWTILRALARVLVQRRRRPGADHLSDHLRRDIGLPERAEPTPLRDLWM